MRITFSKGWFAPVSRWGRADCGLKNTLGDSLCFSGQQGIAPNTNTRRLGPILALLAGLLPAPGQAGGDLMALAHDAYQEKKPPLTCLMQPEPVNIGSHAERSKLFPFSVPVALPSNSERLAGEGLARRLVVQNPGVLKLFADFEDLGLLALTTEPPPGRRNDMNEDLPYLRGMQMLVDRGVIRPGTLVLSNTGHDIPSAAQLLRNQRFHSQAVFHLPASIREYSECGSTFRLINQAQDWGAEIARLQAMHAPEQPDVIFVALDGHESEKLDPAILPDRRQLEAAGIQRVVFLEEENPDAPAESVKRLVKLNIRAYLARLGLPVEYAGADCRRTTPRVC